MQIQFLTDLQGCNQFESWSTEELREKTYDLSLVSGKRPASFPAKNNLQKSSFLNQMMEK